MAPIFIIGYMACGKTTFGRALARATGKQFIDLDFYIEQRFRRPIGRIFAEDGEEEFRRMEAEMLREAGEFEDVIVACGGGTPCFRGNMDYMLSRGTTLFLEASEERIVERLCANSRRRPLMAGKSRAEIEAAVAEGLAARMPFYSRASMRFNGDSLDNRRQIENSISNFLIEHPLNHTP